MVDVDIGIMAAEEPYEDMVGVLMPYCIASAKEAGIYELQPKHKVLKKAYDQGRLETLYIFAGDVLAGYAVVMPHDDLFTDRVYANVLSFYIVPQYRPRLKTIMYALRDYVSNLFPVVTHMKFAIPNCKKKFGNPCDMVCIIDVE